MSMPPLGHPLHPQMQALYGPTGRPPLPPDPPPPDPALVKAAQAATQEVLNELLSVLRQLIVNGSPPDQARHSAKVGARRFSSVPPCPEGHLGCEVVFKSGGWGKGSTRQQIVGWEFPSWKILPHKVYESDGDTSSGGGGYHDVKKSFYLDRQGKIFDSQVKLVGSINGLDASKVPPEYKTFSDYSYGSAETIALKRKQSATNLVRSELSRWSTVLAGGPDPAVRSDSGHARTVIVPWLLREMRKRNSPDLKKIDGSGVFRKRGWENSAAGRWVLFEDGTAAYIQFEKPRPVTDKDIEHLRNLARQYDLGTPPGDEPLLNLGR